MGGGAGRLLDDTSGPASATRKPRPVSRSGCVLFASAGFVGCFGVVKAHGGSVENFRWLILRVAMVWQDAKVYSS
jgi:hypothetical protein